MRGRETEIESRGEERGEGEGERERRRRGEIETERDRDRERQREREAVVRNSNDVLFSSVSLVNKPLNHVMEIVCCVSEFCVRIEILESGTFISIPSLSLYSPVEVLYFNLGKPGRVRFM